MNRSIDVPALVTGLVLTGFGALAAWVWQGGGLVGPAPMWFAAVLLGAGITGLLVTLARSHDEPHP